MLRRSIVAALVMVVVGGFVLAETLRGTITSIDGDKITVTVRKKGEKKGEKKELTGAKTAKYFKSKGKDKDAEATDLAAVQAAVEKAGKRGVFATIEEEGGKATKITIAGGGKKRKKKSDTE